MKVECPTCQKNVLWHPDSTFRPFCSKRCQMIDLGEWADEKHTIAGQPSAQIDDMSDAELTAFIQNQKTNSPS